MVVRTKQDAARVLSDIEGDKRFYSNDGSVLSNVQQLAEFLDRINDDFYYYHVTPEKNDFSRWVGEVVGDDKLANSLSRALNRLEAAEIVKARVVWLREKAKK